MPLLAHQSTNTKLAMNADITDQWDTWTLSLAPADLVSGINTCPAASPGCKAACLFGAGRGVMRPVEAARKRKTEFFRDDQKGFMAELVRELEKAVRKCKKTGKRPAVRLNMMSDIAWETVAVTRGGEEYSSVMTAFPEITFYDYTKIPRRALRALQADWPAGGLRVAREEKKGAWPRNYLLTFSRSEVNGVIAERLAETGVNVAVVFSGELPETYLGLPVIDGTKHDMRFLDERGVIVGLKPKGKKAQKDDTGFVVKGCEKKETAA